MKQITSSEWKNLHSDYKLSRPDGTRMLLELTDAGTCLVPVEIVGPSSEADQVALERLAAEVNG